jgi:hypothetical protein
MQVTDRLHNMTQPLLVDDMRVPQIRTRSRPSTYTVCQKSTIKQLPRRCLISRVKYKKKQLTEKW